MAILAKSHQRGFSLIEVLIAVVIMAFGLLGMGALQLLSMKHSQSSLQRSAATLLAAQMADNIRANKTALNQYVKDINLAENSEVDIPDCINQVCDAEAMANFDLAIWQVDIANALSTQATASITTEDFTLTSGDVVKELIIRLTWPERSTKEESEANDATNDAQKAQGITLISHELRMIP